MMRCFRANGAAPEEAEAGYARRSGRGMGAELSLKREFI